MSVLAAIYVNRGGVRFGSAPNFPVPSNGSVASRISEFEKRPGTPNLLQLACALNGSERQRNEVSRFAQCRRNSDAIFLKFLTALVDFLSLVIPLITLHHTAENKHHIAFTTSKD